MAKFLLCLKIEHLALSETKAFASSTSCLSAGFMVGLVSPDVKSYLAFSKYCKATTPHGYSKNLSTYNVCALARYRPGLESPIGVTRYLEPDSFGTLAKTS